MNLYITEKPSVARIIKDYLNNSGANFTSTTTNKETDSPFSLILTVIVLPGALATCSDYWILKNTIQSTQAGMKHYFPSIQKN